MPTTVEYKAVVKRAMELWADPAFRTREVMEGANNALCAVEVLRVSHGQITGRLVGRGARMMNHHPRQPRWPELEKALAPIAPRGLGNGLLRGSFLYKCGSGCSCGCTKLSVEMRAEASAHRNR